jgi:hypothetical protein
VTACQRCGTEMNGRRKHARFCSDACRALAYRDRHQSTNGTSQTEVALLRQTTQGLITAAQELVTGMQLVLDSGQLIPASIETIRRHRWPQGAENDK